VRSDSSSGNRSLLRRVGAQVRPLRRQIITLFVVDLVTTPIAILAPIPVKIAVDNVIASRPLSGLSSKLFPSVLTGSDTGLLVAASILLLLLVLLGELQGLASYVMRTKIGERLTLGFRSALFLHAQDLSLSFHDERGTSDSIYRIQHDATAIQDATVDGLLPLASSVVMIGALVYMTTALDWKLAIVSFTVIPILFVLSRAYRRRARNWHLAAKGLESVALGVVQETLGALRVVKAFGREQHQHTRFVDRSSAVMGAKIRLAAADSVFGGLIDLTVAAATATVLFVGVRRVQAGALSTGELLVVMAYLSQLFAPLTTITRRVGSLQSSFASAQRAFELLDQEPDVKDAADALPLLRARGELELDRVCFGYRDGHPIVQDISLHLKPGVCVGIAGPTGAGKTTLISLLTRLYDPDSGSIRLDGVDISRYRLADLRRQYGVVLQEPVLFAASIEENIAYARPEATQADIVAAARAAHAHDFITKLPDGYDTQVGERGMQLSGGERQRVSLARAFLKDAPILILDEPTSSVDQATEELILDAMKRLMNGRTTLMISHRLATLEACDARVTIRDGRIVKPRRVRLTAERSRVRSA
jgi:ATP-binding cassette subfamily B protein